MAHFLLDYYYIICMCEYDRVMTSLNSDAFAETPSNFYRLLNLVLFSA